MVTERKKDPVIYLVEGLFGLFICLVLAVVGWYFYEEYISRPQSQKTDSSNFDSQHDYRLRENPHGNWAPGNVGH